MKARPNPTTPTPIASMHLSALLKVKGDLSPLRPRNTDHDEIFSLIIGEYQIPMLDVTGKQTGLAGSARSTFAR
jgi:hypothetical protein